jgi:ribonuclease Z
VQRGNNQNPENTVRNLVANALTLIILCLAATLTQADDGTRVVVLGTGTPVPDYQRAGAGIAVIHNGQAYIFDAGRGVVQRAIEANQRLGITELNPSDVCCLFLTHLHSDHIHDYATLASSDWWRRQSKLKSWGPVGLEALTEAMNRMLEVEATLRIGGTPREGIILLDAQQVEATEIQPGVVFKKDDLQIEAFTVPHGEIKPALGYKITTADKSIVISGDTTYSEEIIRQAKGVDLLFHEVCSRKGLATRPQFWQDYHTASHTPADQLARVASQARPKKLVLYHLLFFGTSELELIEEVRAGYDGTVVLAHDLDTF